MPADFSQIVVHIPVGDHADFVDAYAAANNVLVNTESCTLLLNFNYLDKMPAEERRLGTLRHLARLNGHVLEERWHAPHKSLAQMVASTIPHLERSRPRYWLNHDADLFLERSAFDMLAAHSHRKSRLSAIYQFFDVANERGYSDYDDRWCDSEAAETLAGFDVRALCFRRSNQQDHVPLSAPVWTGAFMVPLPLPDSLVAKMAGWSKGVRGYDKLVTDELCKKAMLLQGAVAYHKGVGTPLTSKRWTSFHPEIVGDPAAHAFLPNPRSEHDQDSDSHEQPQQRRQRP